MAAGRSLNFYQNFTNWPEDWLFKRLAPPAAAARGALASAARLAARGRIGWPARGECGPV
jgi:hypothetical protein